MQRPLLLDSYAAKTCPHALHLRVVTDPADALPIPDVVLRRMAKGIEFERLVGARLEALAPNDRWLFLPSDRERAADEEGWRADRQARLARTVAALEARIPLVWNPGLPPDLAGHRSGEPDLLRCSSSGTYFFPLDVKAHRVARASSPSRHPFEHPLASLLDDGPPAELLPVGACGHVEDLLQLAHYYSMLGALGLAASAPRLGAIIGLASDGSGEPVVTWVDLDEADIRFRSSLTLELSSGSVLDWYSNAFCDALDVVERAIAVAEGADVPPLSEPWFLEGVCSSCAWRAPCGGEMLAASHVSLVKPRTSLRAGLRAGGIRTIESLAHVTDDELLAMESWRRAVRGARMALAGEAVPMALYPELRTDKRPRLWRRPGEPSPWAVERADVELDVDMENTDDFVYLWGTLLSYRSPDLALPSLAPGYRSFGGAFPVMDEAAECEVFVEFWTFLDAVRAACAAAGRSFAAFGYNLGAAEDRWMSRCAALLDAAEGGARWAGRVAALRDSGQWRDLLADVRARFESLNGLGLKLVATSLGFHWRDDDPGGGNSMLWYEVAVGDADERVRADYRRRLLTYNEDDVSATLLVRDWLSAHGPDAVEVLSEEQYEVKTAF